MSNEISERLFKEYDSIKKYNAVPTEQKTGRLHLNENLFKPSPKCIEVLKNISYEDLYEYDLTAQDDLEVELSRYLNIPIENIFVHNGSAEVIKTILAITLNKNDTILLPQPGWSYYKSVSDEKFAKDIYYSVISGSEEYYHDIDEILKKSREFNPKVIVITTPNMPTGNIIPAENLEKIARQNPDTLILVDEAYLGFSPNKYDTLKFISIASNIVFVRTFSKYFGLANVRIGYGICSPKIKHIFGLDLPLFRSSIINRNIAIAALKDKPYYDKMEKEIIEVREWFFEKLKSFSGVKPYKTHSNFIFLHLDGYDVQKMKDWMEKNGILIRLFVDNSRLAMRITIGPRNIMEKTLALFGEACKIHTL